MTQHSSLNTRDATAFHQQLGAVIREFRLLNQLTICDLAAALGISYQQMQKYEKGINRINVYYLCKIADACQITPDTIIREVHTPAQRSDHYEKQLLAALRNIPHADSRALLLGVAKLLKETGNVDA